MTGDIVADGSLPADNTSPAGHKRDSGRPSGLALVLIAALVLVAAVAAWAAVAQWERAAYVGRVLDGATRFTASEATRQDDRVNGASIAFALTFLVTATLFITWFAIRIHHVHDLRPGRLRRGFGWSIGAWFVPVLSLVWPKQIADDAWRTATDPAPRPPVVFHLWWAAWLLGAITHEAGVLINDSQRDSTTLMWGDRITALGSGMLVAAAFLAAAVVAKVDVAVLGMAPLPQPVRPQAAGPYLAWQPPVAMVFNPPPGWPAPPLGWVPPPGWQPDPDWPPAPYGWQFWVPVASPER